MNLFLILSIFNTISLPTDTLVLNEVQVVASLKQQGVFEQAASVSGFSMNEIESQKIESSKDLSLVTPNFYQPDYGSKMTSSLYVRGLGARIDQPAMGLYVDNIPILNKNGYDFDFYDIRRIEVLRGPQGTLYGRNAVGGVINIFTLSPQNYEGTRFSGGYGSKNTFDVNLATYRKITQKVSMSIAVNHRQSDGFFTNSYNGENADKFMSNGARMCYLHTINDRWSANYTVWFNTVKQDGFAYAHYDLQTKKSLPINHNDPCSYDRTAITNGLTFRYFGEKFIAESTTSFQYLNDKMTLDQDFLPLSYFTITQAQNEKAVTQEVILKSNSNKNWQWVSGFFGFYKHLTMNAPVTFKQTGIDSLILKNANHGLAYVSPDLKMNFSENEFPINSNFTLPNFGLSLYHQSSYKVKKVTFTAGIRFDYEQAAIRYTSSALIHYRLNANAGVWANPDFYKPVDTKMSGSQSKPFFNILPKFSVMYNFAKGNVYGSVAKGYKTGGYNTQIFSDILQSQMMTDLMNDLGVHLDNQPISTLKDVFYKPEHSWNYEIGTTLRFFANKFTANGVLFYVDCTDQQLTVFPPGKSTGRKMSNAGHTRSYGAEVSLNYADEKFRFSANYGYTNAKFLQFNDGNNDFAGKIIPYAPQNTVAFVGEYNISVNKSYLHKILLQVNWQGVGDIFWNEENTISQKFYGLLGAQISLVKGNASISFWGKNLTNTDYNTFYFKSIGNSFVQKGKPLQMGISVRCDF
ncbi:MAG: TonB-dependent receptor [Paludibacter sp.]|jgi:outer membrane receptor protein involved in Fe transport|nr:TonB-dependent receptor [Paludibacter sp.]